MKIPAYISWPMLAVTAALWALVGFAVAEVSAQKEAHAGLVSSAQDRAIKDSSLIKLQGLLMETKNERAAFSSAIPSDVLSVVDLIDAAAKTAGTEVQISNAQHLGVVSEKASLSAVAFVIQAGGTFERMARLSELLGSLPSPSILEQLELTRSNENKEWNLTVRIKFLTSAPISS